jgi:hypothetical protein
MTADHPGNGQDGSIGLREFLVRNVYPSTKQELLERAERRGVDPDAIRELEQITDREYDTFAEVGFELGDETSGG